MIASSALIFSSSSNSSSKELLLEPNPISSKVPRAKTAAALTCKRKLWSEITMLKEG